MILDPNLLEKSWEIAKTALQSQELPPFIKDRWLNALEKAKARLLEQPYFAWQPEQLTIVSIPKGKQGKQGKPHKTFSRFYQATGERCLRLDKVGYCQAFYEGFPCWHRAAFLLLGIYFGWAGKICFEKTGGKFVSVKSVNQS